LCYAQAGLLSCVNQRLSCLQVASGAINIFGSNVAPYQPSFGRRVGNSQGCGEFDLCLVLASFGRLQPFLSRLDSSPTLAKDLEWLADGVGRLPLARAIAGGSVEILCEGINGGVT
jgi:hypothetical protein